MGIWVREGGSKAVEEINFDLEEFDIPPNRPAVGVWFEGRTRDSVIDGCLSPDDETTDHVTFCALNRTVIS